MVTTLKGTIEKRDDAVESEHHHLAQRVFRFACEPLGPFVRQANWRNPTQVDMARSRPVALAHVSQRKERPCGRVAGSHLHRAATRLLKAC